MCTELIALICTFIAVRMKLRRRIHGMSVDFFFNLKRGLGKIVIFFFSFISIKADAQFLDLDKHIQLEKSMSNNVYNVFQDSKGIQWFCTDFGVIKYNGVSLKQFTMYDGLPDNQIFNCFEDQMGKIWFYTYNGKLGYYFKGEFYNENNTPHLKQKRKKRKVIRMISNEVDNSLYVLHDFDSIIAEVTAKGIEDLPISSFISSNTDEIISTYSFSNKGTNRHFIYFSHKDDNDVIQYLGYYGEKQIFKSEQILKRGDIHLNHYKNNWYLINNKLIDMLDGKEIASINFYLPIYSIEKIGDVFYIGSNKGLFILKNNKVVGHYLKDEFIRSVAYINQSLIVSTAGKGVYYYRIANNKKEQKKAIVEKDFRNITKLKTSSVKAIRSLLPEKIKIPISDKSYPIIWQSDILFSQNKEHYWLQQFSSGKSMWINKSNYYPYQIHYKSDAYILFNSGEILGYQNFKNTFIDYRVGKIYHAQIAPDKTIWVSRPDSLYISDINGKYLGRVQSKDYYFDFCFLDNFFIGINQSNELVFTNYDIKKWQPRIYNPNQFFRKLHKLNEDWLLMSTIDGKIFLSQAKPHANYFKLYSVPKSLNNDNFESAFVIHDSIYYQVDEGFVGQHIQRLIDSHRPPKLIFQKIVLNSNKSIYNSDVSLNYKERQKLSIYFDAVHFGMEETKIYYQIIFNNDTSAKMYIDDYKLDLISLQTGDHEIKIVAENEFSRLSDTKIIRIHIQLPYWRSWWFLICSIIFGSLILFFIIKHFIENRLERQEIKHREEVRFISSELKSLNAMMNSHFIFNSLNSIKTLIIKKHNETAKEYLSLFGELIRRNLMNLRNGQTTLEKEIYNTEQYLKMQKLRFKEKLDYSINIDNQMDYLGYEIPPLAIQTLVENCIKHGIEKKELSNLKVLVNIYEEDDNIYIDVKDNGENWEENTASNNKGLGLDNLRERLNYLNTINNLQYTLAIKSDNEGKNKFVQIIISDK